MLEHVGVEDGSRAARDGGIDGGGFSVQVGFSLCVGYTVLSVFLGLTFDRWTYVRPYHGTGFVSVDQNSSIRSVIG